MAGMAHDRSRKPAEDDEEDPVEVMIKKTGCIELHYKVQLEVFIVFYTFLTCRLTMNTMGVFFLQLRRHSIHRIKNNKNLPPDLEKFDEADAKQECMADHGDWRKCQVDVQNFKKCMMDYQVKQIQKKNGT